MLLIGIGSTSEPVSTSMVLARNSQFKVFFATTLRLHLRLHLKYSSYSPTSDFTVRAKKALEVGVLESWNLRGGEWEKVWGRRQKRRVEFRSELCDLFVFVLKIMRVRTKNLNEVFIFCRAKVESIEKFFLSSRGFKKSLI